MPIVYVHGVSIRDDREWSDLELLLRRYVAPKIANDPENVQISRCYWGDFGAKFRWSGASSPSSPARTALEKVLEKTAKNIVAVAAGDTEQNTSQGGALSDRAREIVKNIRSHTRLKDLTRERLSDLCAEVFASRIKEDSSARALAMIAADEIAHAPMTKALLEKCKNVEDEVKVLEDLIREKYDSARNQLSEQRIKHELPAIGQKLTLNIEEQLARGANSAAFALTRAAVEIKSPMNRFVTLFIGDVLTYIHERGNYKAPGWIPSALIAALADARRNQSERDGEPLIVMSHSMGGQVMYDMVTHFLAKDPDCAGIRIDFWVATASQVGLFEELKLFLESSDEYSMMGGPVPFPDRNILGYWWNVWDHNDFISYSVKGIIDEVDDEPYSSGLFVVDAHGGYLLMPSFFRKFAKKLEAAKANNWFRPVLETSH